MAHNDKITHFLELRASLSNIHFPYWNCYLQQYHNSSKIRKFLNYHFWRSHALDCCVHWLGQSPTWTPLNTALFWVLMSTLHLCFSMRWDRIQKNCLMWLATTTPNVCLFKFMSELRCKSSKRWEQRFSSAFNNLLNNLGCVEVLNLKWWIYYEHKVQYLWNRVSFWDLFGYKTCHLPLKCVCPIQKAHLP